MSRQKLKISLQKKKRNALDAGKVLFLQVDNINSKSQVEAVKVKKK